MPVFKVEPSPADELSPYHDPNLCTSCVIRELIYRRIGRTENVMSDDPVVAEVMIEVAMTLGYFAVGMDQSAVEATFNAGVKTYIVNGGDLEIISVDYEQRDEQGDVIPKMKN